MQLYEGSGIDGTLLHSTLVNLTPGSTHEYVDVDFSSVTLTVGNLYSAIVIDTTYRWGFDRNQHSSPRTGSLIDGRIDYVGGHLIADGMIMTWGDARFRVIPAVIPIPPALWLFSSGLLGLLGVTWRAAKG